MRFRSEIVVALAMLAYGCGGKLAGNGDGSDVGTGSSGVGSCGTADDAGPFVGTWTCQYTSVPIGPSIPGQIQQPQSAARPFTFSESDGGLTLALGPSSLTRDAGPGVAPPLCASLRMTVAGNTATLDGQQSCWDEYDSNDDVYASGTFTVSGCGASFSDFVSTGRAFTSQWVTIEDKASGTCTRNY